MCIRDSHNLLQKVTIEGDSSSSEADTYRFTYYGRTSAGPDYWGYGGTGNRMSEEFKRIPLLYEKVRGDVGASDTYTNI